MSLPIHFFTIVLDGQPFVRYHAEVFQKLPFPWHWHVIEGVADLVHDTAWTLRHGGRVPQQYQAGRSIDGTTEYLDQLVGRFPGRITVYRKPPGVRWEGKRQMVAAPLPYILSGCLLWQIDVDEFWTADQFIAARQLFLDHPPKTAAYFWCRFFVGPKLLITTRNTYGNHPNIEWLRVWRYRPGMAWAAHSPPVLVEQASPGQWRNVAQINPFTHDETEAAGLVFQHYAYAMLPQLVFKQEYYGYAGAVEGWNRLQANNNFPAPLSQFFPWAHDGAMVDRAERHLDKLLIDAVLPP